MNKFALALTFLIGTIYSTTALAANSWYFKGNSDVVLLNDSTVTINSSGNTYDITFDPGFGIGGGVGYKSNIYRIEADIAYSNNSVDKFASIDATDGDFSSLGFLLSGFLDFETNTYFKPYLGVGAGFTRVDADSIELANGATISSQDDTVFAFKAELGAGFPIFDRGTLDIGYSYFSTEDLSWSGVELEYDAHKIAVAFRYSLQ